MAVPGRLVLFANELSPFARKVLVCAKELGLEHLISVKRVMVNPTQPPDPELARANPLLKIPTLQTDEGFALFESSLICQYLDDRAQRLPGIAARPRTLMPSKWQNLRVEAIADGVLDAGVLLRYETLLRQPIERQLAGWVEGQTRKVLSGLDVLESETEWRAPGSPIHIGQIAVACALGWLEFRKPVSDVRTGRPRLFQWYDDFSRRESLAATRPPA